MAHDHDNHLSELTTEAVKLIDDTVTQLCDLAKLLSPPSRQYGGRVDFRHYIKPSLKHSSIVIQAMIELERAKYRLITDSDFASSDPTSEPLGPIQHCPSCSVKFQKVHDVDAYLASLPTSPTPSLDKVGYDHSEYPEGYFSVHAQADDIHPAPDWLTKPYADAGHDVRSLFNDQMGNKCKTCGSHQINLSEDLQYGEMRKCVQSTPLSDESMAESSATEPKEAWDAYTLWTSLGKNRHLNWHAFQAGWLAAAANDETKCPTCRGFRYLVTTPPTCSEGTIRLNPGVSIVFVPPFSEEPIHTRHWPIGTNLLDANQAEEMVRFMLDGLPSKITLTS